MRASVEEVQSLPEYSVYLLSTHKIIGISTISRVDHSTAQTRELACTKVVLPQVIGRG